MASNAFPIQFAIPFQLIDGSGNDFFTVGNPVAGACDVTFGGDTVVGNLYIYQASGQEWVFEQNGDFTFIDTTSETHVLWDAATLSLGDGTTVNGNFNALVANGEVDFSAAGNVLFSESTMIDTSGNLTMGTGTQINLAGGGYILSALPAMADATSTLDIVAQFNTLLAELRACGFLLT